MRSAVDRPNAGLTMATVASAVVAGAFGLVIAWSSEHRPSSAWATWTLVATAMTSASGAAFVYGVRRWRVLGEISSVRARDAAAPVGGHVADRPPFRSGLPGCQPSSCWQMGVASGPFDSDRWNRCSALHCNNRRRWGCCHLLDRRHGITVRTSCSNPSDIAGCPLGA